MECCGLRPLPGAAEAGIGGEWGGGVGVFDKEYPS